MNNKIYPEFIEDFKNYVAGIKNLSASYIDSMLSTLKGFLENITKIKIGNKPIIRNNKIFFIFNFLFFFAITILTILINFYKFRLNYSNINHEFVEYGMICF